MALLKAKGKTVIALWLGWLLLALLAFGVLETWALRTGRLTLSRVTWEASRAWPPLPFVIGLVAGGLAVHFWWHWCPS